MCQSHCSVSEEWFLKKIQNMKKGLGSKAIPVNLSEASVCTYVHINAHIQTEQISSPSYILESSQITNLHFDN